MDRPHLSLWIVLAAAWLSVATTAFLHLTLRSRTDRILVREDGDWRALTGIVERTLFWCGGAVHGCRCEGAELRFALELAHASISQVVHHLSVGYALYLRRRRGWVGGIFRRYLAIPVDAALYWEELVLWLHRPRDSGDCRGAEGNPCWTADAAYRIPRTLPWVCTSRVLEALGGSGVAEYRRRVLRPIASQIEAILTRPAVARRDGTLRVQSSAQVDVGLVAQLVAAELRISYDEMRSESRRRKLTRAKAVAAVLSTRHGASAAAVALLFGRSRSNLIERVEHYRETQPQLFIEVERALTARLGYSARL